MNNEPIPCATCRQALSRSVLAWFEQQDEFTEPHCYVHLTNSESVSWRKWRYARR